MSDRPICAAQEEQVRPRFDYTTVGHVTVDVMADGSRRVGGSAFYSALQAARLGQRALVITQGVAAEIEHLLAPYRGELELEILPAGQTTTLQTSGAGAERSQRVLAWAGPIEEHLTVETSILHLAPVARETPRRWGGSAGFVGLTPQGLVRAWAGRDGKIGHVALAPALMPERCEAIVISEGERESCASLIPGLAGPQSIQNGPEGARERGRIDQGGDPLVAVTAAAAATAIHLPGGGVTHVDVPAIEDFVEDIGAGDVFAAALFVALGRGQAPRRAASFANAAAAVRIAGAGADAIGDEPAIEARLRAVA